MCAACQQAWIDWHKGSQRHIIYTWCVPRHSPSLSECGLLAKPFFALQSVDELLKQLGATGEEPVARPSWHYREQQQQQQNSSSMTLRHALTVCYDIKTPKLQPLLQLLLDQLTAVADGKQQQQKNGSTVRASIDLQVDATGKGKPAAAAAAATGKAAMNPAASIAAVQGLLAADGAAVEQYLAPRHVIDILQECAAAKLTPQQVKTACATGDKGLVGNRRMC
jgi:hypothetical protein